MEASAPMPLMNYLDEIADPRRTGYAHRHDLQEMLVREGRMELALACFDFLPVRSRLDLAGWDEIDIFAHA